MQKLTRCFIKKILRGSYTTYDEATVLNFTVHVTVFGEPEEKVKVI